VSNVQGWYALSTNTIARADLERLQRASLVVHESQLISQPPFGDILIGACKISGRMKGGPMGHSDDCLEFISQLSTIDWLIGQFNRLIHSGALAGPLSPPR
jgi:hypothetical protein